MKKLLIALLAIFTFALMGCDTMRDPSALMTELDPPIEYNILKVYELEIISGKFWFKYEFVMNETETLLYAPKKVVSGINVYLNDRELYVIRSGTENGYSFRIIDLDDAKEILRE